MFDGNIKTDINLLLLVGLPQILPTQNESKARDGEKQTRPAGWWSGGGDCKTT
jgi:hypothetical protein